MMTHPCKSCGAEIEFDTGFSSAVGGQPHRSHATCSECGAKHYVMVDNPDRYDMYQNDEDS